MTTGITCTVLLDGTAENDGSTGDPNDPVILSDLAVTWGRSDTMSQPGPDSCSFSVMDHAGGQAFVSRYRTGARIDVIARGDAFPGPGVPTFGNSGFETTLQTWAASAGSAARTSARFLGGAWSLGVTASPGTVGNVWLGPGSFQPAGTNPDAWDAIPTTAAGQVWTASVALWLPPGAVATIRPALFSGPYATAGTIVGPGRQVIGDGVSWQTLGTDYEVTVADRWVGLFVELQPAGWTWDGVPPALTWDGVDPGWTWDDMGTMYVDDVQVTSPATGATSSVLVFSGRITDLAAGWDTSADSPVVQVTAQGFTADLENRRVGDEPWAVETVELRANRILTLAGLPISIDIDASLAPIVLSYRDVDSAGATGLLQQVATSVDGVLWHAVHQAIGAYLRLEDPSQRASLLILALSTAVPPRIEIVPTNPEDGLDLSACEILRDPVTWIQTVSDVATRVQVSWLIQGVDEAGLPKTEESNVQLIDAPLELTHGTRAISVSTQLQAQTDAYDVAGRVLGRAGPTGWRAGGLTIDDEDVRPGPEGVGMVLDLLDGTSRIGLPLVLGDLPDWTPGGASAGVYLDGGTYRFVSGRWILELIASASDGIGISAAWDELDPAWQWDQWDPAITWDDLRGAGPPRLTRR